MKLAFFNDYRLGVVLAESIVDASSVVSSIPAAHPHDIMRTVIEEWAQFRSVLERHSSNAPKIDLGTVRFRSPLPRPTNVSCMAVNYMENGTLAEAPEINAFLKSPSGIIGDEDTMVLPDVPAVIFEGEAELAVVIGKHASGVKASDAKNYIFGYTNFIDGSARVTRQLSHFYPMKSRDSFAPIGPFIVTADEIENDQDLDVRLWNNGELMQEFNTSDMAHPIDECLEFVTSIHPFEPGDVLATGTNHGGLHPFQDGDRIEMEIDGLGRLRINVEDQLGRTWARETRSMRKAAGLVGTTPQLGGKYADQ